MTTKTTDPARTTQTGVEREVTEGGGRAVLDARACGGDDPILACEAALRNAQLAGDVAALERLIDDALVFTALDGSVVGKSDDLALHRSGRLKITQMDPSERRVQRYGPIAVVSVRMEATASIDGAVVSGPLRYTRVWCERPDGWRIVAGHMSAVSG